MRFDILTLFPEMVRDGLNTSILKRAAENHLIDIRAVNIRDYTLDKHNKVDDYPYGGGAGMLMQAQPVYDAYLSLWEPSDEEVTCKQETDAEVADKQETDAENVGRLETPENMTIPEPSDCQQKDRIPKHRVIYVTPQGETFTQKMAEELAGEEELVFLCGHYEGIDERVLEEIVTDYVSIGDYVLTGGELPAMVMIDAIARLIPGVLNNDVSAEFESFQDDLLEYPQYSRPEEWRGKKVPQILLSGHHKNIEAWRLEQSVERTKKRRPDLYTKWLERQPEKIRRKYMADNETS